MIGYPSGQDGAILPARDYPLYPASKFHKSHIINPLLTKCEVKMAGYWPGSFFCEFMDLDFVSVHKHAKKELGQYLAILTSHLVNNPYILTVSNHVWAQRNYYYLFIYFFFAEKKIFFYFIYLESHDISIYYH